MASAAVDHVIWIIVYALEKEASLLGGINDELNSLKNELGSMKSFLVEFEKKQLTSESEKTWIDNVRDMAYKAEDIIDEFLYYMHRQRQGNRSTQFIRQVFKAPKYLQVKHRIATKLLNINKNIKEIQEMRLRYKIDLVEGSSSDHNSSLLQRDSSIFMKKDDLVGFENESQLLSSWLEDEELQQTLISVVGMGGSGKTSLVAEICRNETMKSHFDCHAWITVSQTYKRDEIFRSIIKELYEPRKEEIPPDLGTKGYKELGDLLISYLQHKRYLIVLDDVWDTNLWALIMVVLPNNQLRSRIVLTTRREDVGSFSSGVKCYTIHVLPLKSSEAWDLFSKKAFISYPNKSCPEGLEQLARELVERCKGLPLAIDALGALMSSKKSTGEWSSISNNLEWQLSNNQNLEVVKTILLLSYNELPYPLKHCFLYCCLFPEDCEIRRKRLIRLWTAEGFIIQGNSKTQKEVAESYLMDLIFRSMLQVAERNHSGRPKKCKMHDILHDLALSISQREKFCSVYDGNSNFASEKSKSRRLSIQTTYGDTDSYSGMLQVRSLLVFVTNSESFPNTLLSKFKLLRALDLEDSMIEILADGLGTLFNLRYLNLKGTQVAVLPRSIGKLFNLETLNIGDTRITELPKEVVGLQKLRYILMYSLSDNWFEFHHIRGTRAPFKINKLKNLQFMSIVAAEGDIITQLGTMKQLIKVGISNLKEANEMELCSSIMNLHQLYCLSLVASDENEFLRSDALESPPPHLRTLWLVGRLERVPPWFLSLQHLVYLCLQWSRLQGDPLPRIASLPHLAKLLLWNAFSGKELNFSSGFAKLTTLQLANLPELTVVSIEKRVMPDIQELSLRRCKKLTSLPGGIEFLTNLQSLYLLENSPELGKDLSKVQHIPKICVL